MQISKIIGMKYVIYLCVEDVSLYMTQYFCETLKVIFDIQQRQQYETFIIKINKASKYITQCIALLIYDCT